MSTDLVTVSGKGLDYHETRNLDAELCQAREKFPGNALLLAALMEEAGELARAYLQRQGREQVRKEALQVACVAMRVYREGDSSFDHVTDAQAKP
jgi:NTP pyrophosphatase (non-canonical NTP hydrolase)